MPLGVICFSKQLTPFIYSGQFPFSTHLIKPDYLMVPPLMQYHSFYRNIPPPLLQVMFCVLVCTLPVTLVAPHHRGGSVFLPVTCVILVLPHPYFMKSLHIWLGFTHKIIHSQLYFFCMFCKLWNIGEFSKHPLLYAPTLLMHIHACTDWKMQVKNLEEN